MHLAVHPDYSMQGEHAGTGLGVILVEKVKEIAAQIVGINGWFFSTGAKWFMRL